MTTFSELTYHVRTFGCQMNKHDSERVQGILENLGALPVETIEEADVVVFMTCCVREAADVRLEGQVSSMRNLAMRPESPLRKRIIAIGGCIGQRDGARLFESLDNATVVFGTNNLAALPGLIQEVLDGEKHAVQVVEESTLFASDLPSVRDRAWAAWLPITIGCNNFCTYCIVPYVRGREKSRTFDEIVTEAEGYVASGVKEITLLGQNVNSYGRDLYGEARFAQILDAVDATGIERLRFATSHPKDLNDSVIERFATLRSLMPALHLPVQSGSDRILEMMNRRYDAAHYRELIAKVRDACPEIALSTDIIVGFPGETEEDFMRTYELVEEIGYAQVFTFIYSKREGTPAAKMPDDTPREVIQERFERLVDLVQKKAFEQNQPEAGRIVDVLVEGASKRDASLIQGKSPKNQTVHAPVPEGMRIDDLVGTIVPVHIDIAKTWYLSGTILLQNSGR